MPVMPVGKPRDKRATEIKLSLIRKLYIFVVVINIIRQFVQFV
jgi:hypothetical protein